MLRRSKKTGTRAMFFDPPRTLAFWLINGIPAAALTLIIAALIQPAIWATAGLASVVGVGAWTAELRRRSDLLPPSAFIGS
jgi:hypothetical protein